MTRVHGSSIMSTISPRDSFQYCYMSTISPEDSTANVIGEFQNSNHSYFWLFDDAHQASFTYNVLWKQNCFLPLILIQFSFVSIVCYCILTPMLLGQAQVFLVLVTFHKICPNREKPEPASLFKDLIVSFEKRSFAWQTYCKLEAKRNVTEFSYQGFKNILCFLGHIEHCIAAEQEKSYYIQHVLNVLCLHTPEGAWLEFLHCLLHRAAGNGILSHNSIVGMLSQTAQVTAKQFLAALS